jgi:two-component system LytT family response regulator
MYLSPEEPNMEKIKALLVDDEISAINTLRGMLEKFCPQVQILNHASTVSQALEFIERYDPQLLFLDVEMPPFGNAFDLLKHTKSYKFGVIFTTAYPKYALQAIKAAQPWAYLVKPYSVKDLSDAVDVAAEKIELLNAHQELEDKSPTRLVLTDSRKGKVIIRFHEILYCQSEHATVDIYLHRNGFTEKITTYRTLRELEKELPEHLFARTHNSYLVNLSHIVRVERTGRNGVIFLPDEVQVQISVLRMAEFEQKLQAFLQ